MVLAKWLACKPDVLVLNGPTVGVDIGSKHDIHRILQRLANEGMAVIIISDDLPEVLQNCSHLLIMKDGRIVARPDPGSTDRTPCFRTCCKGREHMKKKFRKLISRTGLYRWFSSPLPLIQLRSGQFFTPNNIVDILSAWWCRASLPWAPSW